MWSRFTVAAGFTFILALPAFAQTPVLLPEPLTTEVMEVEDEELLAPDEAEQGPFWVYVVRHAEKQDGDLDPGLTKSGYTRAQNLGQMLEQAGIEKIYTTYYRRSTGTALPLARELNLPIEFYKAEEYEALLEMLQAQGVNALVVGHSNTVPQIVRALGGEAEDMDDSRFGDLFQLYLADDEVLQVHLRMPLLDSD